MLVVFHMMQAYLVSLYYPDNFMLNVNASQVPPGEYRLSAFAATPENAPDLLLSPSHVDIKVSSPTLNVSFYQVILLP